MKKNLIVSFSGGETSAYMAQWLWNNKRDQYNMRFVFANTGQENEETLLFVQKCSEYFNIPIVWVEAVPRVKLSGKIIEMCSEVFGLKWRGARIGTTYKKVTFETASRNGEPFERVIQKYGIPNMATPHCTRELKEHPINAYAKALGWVNYYTAIGIRSDEIDRINEKRVEKRLIYPLIEMRPMSKAKINFWWSQQPFRLNLKGYQGNCMVCWKKTDSKLYQIAIESPDKFSWTKDMEVKYKNYVPETRLELMSARKELPTLPVRFFRKNRSVDDILNESEQWNGIANDDTQTFDSCEVFSECN